MGSASCSFKEAPLVRLNVRLFTHSLARKMTFFLAWRGGGGGGGAKYLADELQSTQNRCLDFIGIPRTSLLMLEERPKVATERESETIVNDKT